MKTRALSKDDRKRQIMLAFAVDLQAGHEGKMTSVDIAHKIGLVPSDHVRKFINELVTEGLLVSEKQEMTGAVGHRFVYSPSALFDSCTGEQKREPRTITIKTTRKGQLALFTEVFS